MSYLLLVCIVLFFVIFPFYYIFNFRLFSPSIINCLMFVFSISLAYVGLFSWNNQYDLNFMVYVIIFFGLLSFCFGELLSKIKITHNNKLKTVEKYSINSTIKIGKYKNLISIFFYLLTILFIILDLKKICIMYSFNSSSLSEMISFYRYKSSLFSDDGVSFGFLTLQLIKVCNILSIIYIYIFVNNVVKEKNIKNNVVYAIPIVLCFILGFLQSGRAYILKYIVSAFIIYSVLLVKNDSNVTKKNDRKILKKVIISLITILPLFYFILPLFGRSTSSSFIDYISFYFGCPIPSLNVFFNSNVINVDRTLFGEHTFFAIYKFLDKVNLLDFDGVRSLNFIKFGTISSNVYTCFFRSYVDFNFFITMLLTVISGFVYGKMYQFSVNKSNIKYLLFYAYFSANFVDMFRDETFFSSFISPTTVSYFVILNILVWFFLKEYRYNNLN